MDTFLCPKGHASTEPDYCSECGVKIGTTRMGGAAPGAFTPERTAASAAETCPECGAAREQNDIAFCEICGYNFVTGARGEMPFASTATPASISVEAQPVAASGEDAAPMREVPGTWEITVTVDPALREQGSPQPPLGVGPFVFSLAEPVNLIGRRSEARGIFPQIPLGHDDAVSHRHALLQLAPGGTLLLRDIGAANGTRLNGKEIAPMIDHPLGDGDAITVGHWSRLLVKAVG